MREYTFTELGYFSETECKAIQQVFKERPTCMKFEVSWSNNAGNCTLIAKTDWAKFLPDKEVKNFFIACALSRLAGAVI